MLQLVGFYLDEVNVDDAWIITWWQANGDVSSYIKRTNPDWDTRLRLVSAVIVHTSV